MLSKGSVPEGDSTLGWYAHVFVVRDWCGSIERDVVGSHRHSIFVEQGYALTEAWVNTGTVHARGSSKTTRHRGVINLIVPQIG